jgi:hypothetical protein
MRQLLNLIKKNIIDDRRVVFSFLLVPIFIVIVGFWLNISGNLIYSVSACFFSLGVGTAFLNIWRLIHISRLENKRGLKQNEVAVQQTYAWINIQSYLQMELPLPVFDSFSASPDFIQFLLNYVSTQKPKFIVECGSGISTVVLGYALKKNGFGKLIALEHNKDYFLRTESLIKHHGLDSFVQIKHAPLGKITIKNLEWEWYKLDKEWFQAPIELLVVDGPPKATGPLARYPTLPKIQPYLASGAGILLDDYDRFDEKEIVRRWMIEHDCSLEEKNLNKGLAFLHYNKPAN